MQSAVLRSSSLNFPARICGWWAILPTAILSAVLCVPVNTIAQPPESQSLRAETTIEMEGHEGSPLVQTLTLFDRDVVYDVQMPAAKHVTVFDIPRAQIVMLDKGRQLRTTIKPNQLIEYMTAIRTEATQLGKADAMGIGTQPVADPETGIVRAGFRGMLYIAETKPAGKPEIARKYNEFTDWATRLNVFHRPSGAPFARLALSQKMRNGGLLPTKITRRATRGDQSQTLISKHQYGTMISMSDRAMISKIGGMLASYKDVPINDFRGLRVSAK